MAYIGRTPQVGNYSKLDDISASFNGSLTAFSMTVSGAAYTASQAAQLIVSVGGVLQEPEGGYTVSGSTITFTSPPASSADFFAVALGDTLDIGTPSDGTVTAAKLADTSVTVAKLGTGALIGTNIQAFDADTAKTDAVQTFTVSQRGGVTNHGTLIANTAFRQDLSLSNHYKMTLAGSITINNPTNQVAGQSGAIEIINGGSYTVSWGSDWDFAAGTAPVITASGTDLLSYYVSSANNIVVDALQNLS
jgi:hypothetical protein|tara:strand:+ start:114 stop:860 length:747 start_codon:yes stop_codon:yes gene_type:complete